MSRVVTHNDSWSGVFSSFDSTNSTVTMTNTNNALTGTSSSTYATYNPSSNGTYYIYFNYGVNNIPSNATISSIVCSVRLRGYIQGGRGSTVIQMSSGTNVKGDPVTDTSSSATTVSISNCGTWTASEILNAKIKFTATRSKSGYYIWVYGSDLSFDYSWDETFYEFTCNSSVQGVGISAQDSETTSGGTNVITVTGVSDLSNIKLMDNGMDVTSSLVMSGSNYTYTISNVSADHTVIVTQTASSGNKIFTKANNTWVQTTNQQVKSNENWKDILKSFKKINNVWVEQDDKSAMFDPNAIYLKV